MSRVAISCIFLFFFCFFSMHQCSAQMRKCGRNEVYLTCGTACPPTCQNPTPSYCTRQCVMGCQCRPGFYLNRYKQCVTLRECRLRN